MIKSRRGIFYPSFSWVLSCPFAKDTPTTGQVDSLAMQKLLVSGPHFLRPSAHS